MLFEKLAVSKIANSYQPKQPQKLMQKKIRPVGHRSVECIRPFTFNEDVMGGGLFIGTSGIDLG